MKKLLVRNIAEPLLRRCGTALAVWLMAGGHDAEIVNQFVTACVAAACVALDLVLARYASNNTEGA